MKMLFMAIVATLLSVGAVDKNVQEENIYSNEEQCCINENSEIEDSIYYVYYKTVEACGIDKRSGIRAPYSKVAIYEDSRNGNLYVGEGRYYIHRNSYSTWGGKDVSRYSHMYYESNDYLWFFNI